MQSITKKIIGVSVRPDSQSPVEKKQVDPDEVKFDKRPTGILSGENRELEMYTQYGKVVVYIGVSYLPVAGIVDGKQVEVERAIECFFRSDKPDIGTGLHTISTMMRIISRAMRTSGDVAGIFADLRQTQWTDGPVRCGSDHQTGKPILNHLSIEAAIGWGFSDMLRQRGLFDDCFRHIPATQRLKENALPKTAEKPLPLTTGQLSVVGKMCRNCHSRIVNQDGCEVCLGCGTSKCA